MIESVSEALYASYSMHESQSFAHVYNQVVPTAARNWKWG